MATRGPDRPGSHAVGFAERRAENPDAFRVSHLPGFRWTRLSGSPVSRSWPSPPPEPPSERPWGLVRGCCCGGMPVRQHLSEARPDPPTPSTNKREGGTGENLTQDISGPLIGFRGKSGSGQGCRGKPQQKIESGFYFSGGPRCRIWRGIRAGRLGFVAPQSQVPSRCWRVDSDCPASTPRGVAPETARLGRSR